MISDGFTAFPLPASVGGERGPLCGAWIFRDHPGLERGSEEYFLSYIIFVPCDANCWAMVCGTGEIGSNPASKIAVAIGYRNRNRWRGRTDERPIPIPTPTLTVKRMARAKFLYAWVRMRAVPISSSPPPSAWQVQYLSPSSFAPGL
jgi:hypothetical protein